MGGDINRLVSTRDPALLYTPVRRNSMSDEMKTRQSKTQKNDLKWVQMRRTRVA
jgi:hypothetical protein